MTISTIVTETESETDRVGDSRVDEDGNDNDNGDCIVLETGIERNLGREYHGDDDVNKEKFNPTGVNF